MWYDGGSQWWFTMVVHNGGSQWWQLMRRWQRMTVVRNGGSSCEKVEAVLDAGEVEVALSGHRLPIEVEALMARLGG